MVVIVLVLSPSIFVCHHLAGEEDEHACPCMVQTWSHFVQAKWTAHSTTNNQQVVGGERHGSKENMSNRQSRLVACASATGVNTPCQNSCQNSWFPSTSTLFLSKMNKGNSNGVGSLDVHSGSDVSSLIRSSSVHLPPPHAKYPCMGMW